MLHFHFPDLGVRNPGIKIRDKFVLIPEMVPELVVPDLTDFKVSHLHHSAIVKSNAFFNSFAVTIII